MTRIIAGAARGARLSVPPAGTRPTSDRVRESLFSALEAQASVEGARVLDLYAGSGALGLEALSRGAASADLVEKSRAAAMIVRKNAALVAAMPGLALARVHERPVRTFLESAHGPFDLVFSDPPYGLTDAEMTADLIALAPLLSPEAVVVIERGRRENAPDFAAAGLELWRERHYGDTTLWWGVPA